MPDKNRTKQGKAKMNVSASSELGSSAGPRSTSRRGQPLSAEIQARIGSKLIEVYDEVLSQPVPDRFLQLLDALDEKVKPQPGSENKNHKNP